MHCNLIRKESTIFPRQIMVPRWLQTAEPHSKTQLPLPMSSTFCGISWY